MKNRQISFPQLMSAILMALKIAGLANYSWTIAMMPMVVELVILLIMLAAVTLLNKIS